MPEKIKRGRASLPRQRRESRDKLVVGWREKVALPDIGVDEIRAKIDTGARTSALHAYRIEPFHRAGCQYVRFYVHPIPRRRKPELFCEALVVDEREVTSSNGKRERRFVVETMLEIGGMRWPIEITLTNRDEMGFRMLLGRQALSRRIVVDPGRSYRLDKKSRIARRNPGETLP